MEIGTPPAEYTQAQLTDMLKRAPSGGNALVILAHQLIAFQLNTAHGASYTVPGYDTPQDAINAANTLIGTLNPLSDSVSSQGGCTVCVDAECSPCSDSDLDDKMIALGCALEGCNAKGACAAPHCGSETTVPTDCT